MKERLTPLSYYTHRFDDQDKFLLLYLPTVIGMNNIGVSLSWLNEILERAEAEKFGNCSDGKINHNFSVYDEQRLFKKHLKHVLYFVHLYEWWSKKSYKDNNTVVNSSDFSKIMFEILNQSNTFPQFTNNYELVASAVITVPRFSYPGRGVWRPKRKIKFEKDGAYAVGNLVVRNKASNDLELWNPDAWIGVGHITNTQKYIYAAQKDNILGKCAPQLNMNYSADSIAMNNLIRNAVFDKDFMTSLLSPRIDRDKNYRKSSRAVPANDTSEIDVMLSPDNFEVMQYILAQEIKVR